MSSGHHARTAIGTPGEHGPPTRRVTMVAFPGIQALDLTGPHEVFAMANRFARRAPGSVPPATAAPGPGNLPYEIEVVAADVGDDRSLRTSSGLRIGVDRRIGPRPTAVDRTIDTVMIVGGEGTVGAVADEGLVGWVRAVAPGCRRITSVCSGAYVLAVAGLLDGRRVTTHWSECEHLQALFPDIDVEADPIFVRDGNVVTSAGITAGMDLALSLVEEDLGREVALEVSRWLVMFVQRSGGQSQFSTQLADQLADRHPLRELQGWIVDHPGEDLSVAVLAARVAMSPRHFARVFGEEVGTTPARFVEGVRVEHARRLLESTDRSIAAIARAAGFGTAETMQRSFRRRVHTTPGDYRRHFTRNLTRNHAVPSPRSSATSPPPTPTSPRAVRTPAS
jgi:transcriptional regulator GlxA family with amidase domain